MVDALFYVLDNGIKWRCAARRLPAVEDRLRDARPVGRKTGCCPTSRAARPGPRGGGPRPRALGRRGGRPVGHGIRRGRRPVRHQRLRPPQERQRPQAPPAGRHRWACSSPSRSPRPAPQDRRRRRPAPARPPAPTAAHRLALLWADNAYHGDWRHWAPPATRHHHRGRPPAPTARRASRSCPAAGSSSAPTPGSPAAAAAPATTNDSPPTTQALVYCAAIYPDDPPPSRRREDNPRPPPEIRDSLIR